MPLGGPEKGPWARPGAGLPFLMVELFPGGLDPALGLTTEEGGRKTRGSRRSTVKGTHREEMKAPETEATGLL